jgi:glycosyltransferase involved in cell wall biosynthesis
MIPVYNGEVTIGQALLSLLAQTVEDWEAVVVDDGSSDRTAGVVRAIRDPRIRLFRFEKNQGRGAARQFALEQSRSEFLAMLDADDWYFPWKLERQLQLFEREPEVGLVSAAMASVGDDGDLRGIWRPLGIGQGERTFPPLRSLFHFEVPYAPSMIRMRLARSVECDLQLRRSEDFHYLAQILRLSPYLLSSEVLYSYTDIVSFQHYGAGQRYLCSALACFKLWKFFPLSSSFRALRSIIQMCLASFLGNRKPVSLTRAMLPSAEEVGAFNRARRHMERFTFKGNELVSMFGAAAAGI